MEHNSQTTAAVLVSTVCRGSEPDPVAEYRTRFCERTRLAREAAGFSRKQMAQILGLSRHVYTKNEERSPLSHMITGAFLNATNVTYEWLSQGVGRGPACSPHGNQRTH